MGFGRRQVGLARDRLQLARDRLQLASTFQDEMCTIGKISAMRSAFPIVDGPPVANALDHRSEGSPFPQSRLDSALSTPIEQHSRSDTIGRRPSARGICLPNRGGDVAKTDLAEQPAG